MGEMPNVSVLILRKRLQSRPTLMSVPGIAVRTFSESDVDGWLALRQAAFAEESPAVRDWSRDEFAAEMLAKPWWRPERTWLAVAENEPNHIAGAVTLAERAGKTARLPVVHWLMVDPAWRRRGVGRLLMSHLEQAAWDAGWRDVQLETHAGWQAAVELYRKLDYEDH
jgi:GNAT superfamily N-acetyltransferase